MRYQITIYCQNCGHKFKSMTVNWTKAQIDFARDHEMFEERYCPNCDTIRPVKRRYIKRTVTKK